MSTEKIAIEREYIKISWFLILAIAVYLLFDKLLFSPAIEALSFSQWLVPLIFLFISAGYNVFKTWLFNKDRQISEEVFRYLKFFEVVNLVFFFGYERLFDLMFVISLVFLFYIERVNIKGLRQVAIVLIFSYTFFIFLDFVTNNINSEDLRNLFYILFYTFWFSSSNKLELFEKSQTNEINIKLKQYEENLKKQQQLSEAKDAKIKELEREISYLKEINKRLNISLGEFFNLQEISKIITQILDTNELLKFVNDVLIGVTGVDKSSILLFNKDKTELYVAFSNLPESEQKESFKQENIEWLKSVALNCENGYRNKVSSEDCPFINGRATKSIMYASLATKNDKYGIILLEHIFEDVFTEDNLRFLTSIAAQVSIALENSSLYQQMRSMAMVDGLTGAFNRIYLYEVLEREIQASAGRYPVSIALFDVDNFKKLNDTYGHLFGDKVLQTIVRIAREKVRKGDIVARYGGEEFIIVFNHLESNEAYKVVERIRRAIESETIEDNLIQTRVTVSFGIASYPLHADNVKDLIKCADVAMYRAKSSGKNCTVVYNQELEMKV
ncbi:diguanylate cyclase with GAF sensor [Caldicellulosiruptor acetigenus I77R1B]|uniref:Diguanylate cyclase with GAF sensor n=2 Tax=Caldicellulosiruptor acetigenus TaxID=301953 RepID=G2PUE3_9FIRM|nr:GGDEF domain-containing protein [Caldicellulosiruptor acetigenus]ADQ40998.1 diguanylate cyclase with GAF sensor [Caldicellulosiruptor acetigenus I77R1B]AEM73535.1 diguanylate cyclase with GAF sensor [Caldicellulosiruptor acetigenus 6A]